MNRLRVVLIAMVLFPYCAWAWGPSTHAHIASCVTEGQNLSVLFGSMLPDCSAVIRDNSAEAYQFNRLTHREFDLLEKSALKTGFKTHNGIWGADYYAHLIYSPVPEEIYSVVKIRQLMQEFGITTSQAEDVFEMCVDIQMRLFYGPSWGALMEQAANASGAEHEQIMVDTYAAELADRVDGLTLGEAEEDIRNAVRGYKSLTITMGEQLQLSEAEIHEVIPPLLALYLDCDVDMAEVYYTRGLELTADCMPEMDRICAAIKEEMPDAFEGEDTGEGENEGEGEPPITIVDFCQAFQQVYENPLLQGLSPEFAAFIELLNPETADLNGTFSVDTSGGIVSLTVEGNGMPDAANELGLFARLLNCPEPFPAGIRSTMVSRDEALAVWQANLAQLNADIGVLASVVSTAAPGFQKVLAGFLTLGDGEFTITSAPTPADPNAPIIASGSGSFGLVAALFTTLNTMIAEELGSGFANPYLNKDDYRNLPVFLPNSDADGDGFSNGDEYAYFTPDTCDIKRHKGNDTDTGYVAAALNYRICPDCESYCADCTDPHGGYYEAGQDAGLRVPGDFPAETPFDWAKEGGGPLFGDRYEGVDCQNLCIYTLAESDSGIYVCTYGTGADTYRTAVTVVESLPVFPGVWQMWLLVAILGCMAGYILRLSRKA